MRQYVEGIVKDKEMSNSKCFIFIIEGDVFGESKIPREDCVIHHTSASLYLFAMFPT
jgi:hypothetical protein